MLSPRMLECSNSDQTDVREARSRSHFMLLTSIFFQSAPPPRPIPFNPTLSSHSAANLVLLLVSLPPAARLRRGNPLSLNKDSPQALIRSGARPVCVIVCVVCACDSVCIWHIFRKWAWLIREFIVWERQEQTAADSERLSAYIAALQKSLKLAHDWCRKSVCVCASKRNWVFSDNSDGYND